MTLPSLKFWLPPMLAAATLGNAPAGPPPATAVPPATAGARDVRVTKSSSRPVERMRFIPAHRKPSAATHRFRSCRSGSAHIVTAANQAATREPDRHGFVNAIQIYPYADGTLYHVYAAPERVTDIALQPGETLGAVASGDTVRWVIGDTSSGTGADKQTHILVKPFATGLSTNLVVTTDRRSYHLALTSTAGSAMIALSWTYPQDQLIALQHAAEAAKAAAPVASGLALDELRFTYAITGDKPAWRPLRAFDDGRQTFIEFPATIAVGETPPLFLVDRKGVAQLVNYRVQGRFYVVDRLFDAAELRLGTKHQEIVRITRTADGETRRRGA